MKPYEALEGPPKPYAVLWSPVQRDEAESRHAERYEALWSTMKAHDKAPRRWLVFVLVVVIVVDVYKEEEREEGGRFVVRFPNQLYKQVITRFLFS